MSELPKKYYKKRLKNGCVSVNAGFNVFRIDFHKIGLYALIGRDENQKQKKDFKFIANLASQKEPIFDFLDYHVFFNDFEKEGVKFNVYLKNVDKITAVRIAKIEAEKLREAEEAKKKKRKSNKKFQGS